MAENPSANVSIDDEAGGFGGGTGFLVVAGCVSRNADCRPRFFGSASGVRALHDYSQASDYVAGHVKKTRKGVLFIGLPIATPGTIGRQNNAKVTGTCAITIAAVASGVAEEVDGKIVVLRGGTIGEPGIEFTFSADGGINNKRIRLLDGTSYTPPYLGIRVDFGAGTLVAGDTYTFATTPPMWDGDGIAAARAELAQQLKRGRSILVVGDIATKNQADQILDEVNAYETENQRFSYVRVNVRDRVALAENSRVTVKMTGAPTLTFAEVGGTGDTITRSAGSWIADGFAVGQTATVAGSASNNVTGKLAGVTATVLTFDTTDLEAEGPVSGCTVTASETYTFAEVGATGDTITRTGGGSWLDDGFRAGDKISITNTASNNITDAELAAVTATVLTLHTTDLAAEEIRGDAVTVRKGETMEEWVSKMDTTFAGVDDQFRIDLGLGRGWTISTTTKWKCRRPAQWAICEREYAPNLDIHIPTYRKSDGPLDGWSLADENGKIVEYDNTTVGGGTQARFSCLRTYSNGPMGAFVALSMTRAAEDSMLSRTHNVAVANHACSIVQAESENQIGAVLVTKDDGTGTEESLQLIEQAVNTELQKELLQQTANGLPPRASLAVWRASRTDILNVPGAELTGELDLRVNSTLEKISTRVRVPTGNS